MGKQWNRHNRNRNRTKYELLIELPTIYKDILPYFQRMSVFEPYPMRDTVQHFCEKHLDKIKGYMESLMVRIPLPVKCSIEERKGRKFAKLHFACQGRTGEYCLYKSSFYTMKTRNPRTWIHLMFLALQVLWHTVPAPLTADLDYRPLLNII